MSEANSGSWVSLGTLLQRYPGNDASPLYGCAHYQRRCKLVAPCCGGTFWCRICHDEAHEGPGGWLGSHGEIRPLIKFYVLICDSNRRLHLLCEFSNLWNVKQKGDAHVLNRFSVTRLECGVCKKQQPVGVTCRFCGERFGRYSCLKCNLFDDCEKGQFHCDECGICRTGGRENFYHCVKCNCCLSNGLKDMHRCVENSMNQDCPVCYEHLFDSLKSAHVLPCGHTLHKSCLTELIDKSWRKCLICSTPLNADRRLCAQRK